MTIRIKTAVIIARPRQAVFNAIRDVRSHTAWMGDAVSINLKSEQLEGEGVRFECHTKLGPIRFIDLMSITCWRENESIGIEHGGRVGGYGEFKLRDYGINQTFFEWNERLTLPLYLGAIAAEQVILPVLKVIFQRDLNNLQRLLEASPVNHS